MIDLGISLTSLCILNQGGGVPSWVPKDGSGNAALLVLDQANNRGWYSGAAYPTEAAALAAVNGTSSGITRAVGDYVAPDAPELLPNGDLSAGIGDWTALNSATAAVVAGELELSGTGLTNPTIRSGAATTAQGKAYRVRAKRRRGTSASSVLVITSRSSTMSPVGNGLPSTTSTTDVTDQRVFGGEGAAAYVGLRTVSGPNGTVYGDEFSIKEATAMAGAKPSEFTGIINFRTPASLPASSKILFSFDDSGARNRYRVVLNADGTISLILDSNGTNRVTNTFAAGLVTLDAAHKLHISSNGSTRFLAALDDINLAGGQGGFTPPGCGWVRIGASPTVGEEWTGTILDAAFFGHEFAPSYYLWAVGDSYVAGVGGASVEAGIEASSSREVISTGDGGSSPATQLTNMQSNPGMYGCPLIHWDGDANGANATTDPAIFEQIASHALRHIFIGSTRRQNHTSGELTATDARNSYLSGRFGSRYHNPMPRLLSLSDGSAGDIAAVDANLVPPSALQADGTHLTPTAMAAVMADVVTLVASLGF